jgi:hypothetical protein
MIDIGHLADVAAVAPSPALAFVEKPAKTARGGRKERSDG